MELKINKKKSWRERERIEDLKRSEEWRVKELES